MLGTTHLTTSHVMVPYHSYVIWHSDTWLSALFGVQSNLHKPTCAGCVYT